MHFGVRILLFALACQSLVSYAQEPSPLKSELQKIIDHDTEIDFMEIPGFILTVIDGDSVYTEGFGSFEEESDSVQRNTIFALGGLSKIFTLFIIDRLVQEQKIDFDQTISEILSNPLNNDQLSEIRICDLISHTSGLPMYPENLRNSDDANKFAQYTVEHLLSYLQHPIELKDHKYHYSHLNYVILQLCMEQATGQTFSQLLNTYLIKPHKLKHTYVASIENMNRLTTGYDRAGRTASPWSFNHFFASEGILSSASDIAILMRNHLTDKISRSDFSKMLAPVAKVHGEKKAMVASGWHLFNNKRSYNLYLHSGKTSGHAASIHFIFETETAVIILTNAPGRLYGLATLTLRMVNNNWKRKANG